MSNLIEKSRNFNQRWNIVSISDYQAEFKKFRTRIFNIFSDVDDKLIDDSILKFCNFFGLSVDDYGNDVINALHNEEDEINFYKMLEIIFCLEFKDEGFNTRFNPQHKKHLFDSFKEAVKLSDINLEVGEDSNGEMILFPRGEALLDERLVNEPLNFLKGSANEHFIDALKFYEKGEPKYRIKAAESLRRTTEEFLRLKLGNNSGLDRNISILQSKLKSDQRDTEVRNIIFTTLSYLDKYFNENSKHKDGDINETECEFLIYQTGLLLRYINENC